MVSLSLRETPPPFTSPETPSLETKVSVFIEGNRGRGVIFFFLLLFLPLFVPEKY